MSVLSSLTIAAVSVLARRPADEATVLSTQSQSTLSLELDGLSCGTLGVLRLRFAILELGESRGSPELSCSGLHCLKPGDSREFSELADSC